MRYAFDWFLPNAALPGLSLPAFSADLARQSTSSSWHVRLKAGWILGD